MARFTIARGSRVNLAFRRIMADRAERRELLEQNAALWRELMTSAVELSDAVEAWTPVDPMTVYPTYHHDKLVEVAIQTEDPDHE